jgi:sterol desaturase/sphingolipid hydroxylase (fatty acid hydroxylase superfamily)
MWHYNFGLALDIWDRVFRTYKPVPWREGLSPELAARRSLVRIRWW